MFKLVQFVANWVAAQYAKEAQRLHNVVGAVDERREAILAEVDELAQELQAEISRIEQEFGEKRRHLIDELTGHDAAIDSHVEAAANATEKAASIAKLVK